MSYTLMETEEKRVRKIFLYVGSFAVAAIAVAGGIYAAHSGNAVKEIIAKVAFFLLSLGVFGMLVRDYRAYWKTARCWMTLSLLFVLHLAAGAFVLHQTPFGQKLFLVALIVFPSEYQILKVFLNSAMNE